MAVKKYKPITPGMRDMTGYTFEEITKDKPERSLLATKKNHAGRNAQGRVTVRHRGGGARRALRIVDFKRDKLSIPARVAAIHASTLKDLRAHVPAHEYCGLAHRRLD